ncbi:MAG: carboxypeptidase-like regulatory domain-containing protein [Planctomycetota bacterium]
MSIRLQALVVVIVGVAALVAALALIGGRGGEAESGSVEPTIPNAPAPGADEAPIEDLAGVRPEGRLAAVRLQGFTKGREVVPPEATAADATPPPDVPDGTALVGTIVDASGDPVRTAELELRADGRGPDVRVEADAHGRFAVAIEVHGERTVAARADGLGRSAERTLTVREGVATDLGVLRLLGDGTLTGRAVFPGGKAFPRLELTATAVDAAASPGLRRTSRTTDASGRFSMAALAPGPFRFAAYGEDRVPILGSDSAQSGDEAVELVVDAVLLRVRCADEQGNTVGMRTIQLATAPDGRRGDEGALTNRFYAGDRDGHEFILATGVPYRLQGTDTDGRTYFALVSEDLPAGIHAVDLMQDVAGLGVFRATLPPQGVDSAAVLAVRRIERDGESVPGMSVWKSGNVAEGCTLEVRGLLPGSYRAQLEVSGDDWFGLETDEHAFRIFAGTTEQIDVTAYMGGAMEFRVGVAGGDSEQQSNLRARVRLRGPASSEWTWADLTSRRSSGATVRGTRVFADRTLARSSVLRPGTYGVEVRAAGFRAVHTEAAVFAGASTEVWIDLERK